MNLQDYVRDYKRLRAISVKLAGVVVNTLASEDIVTAARQLGMLNGRYIDLNTEDESAVLMDHAIQDVYRDGMNTLDRLLQTEPYPEGSTELCLLRSMQSSRFTLLTIEEAIPGVGLRMVDHLRNTPLFLIDINFSYSTKPYPIFAARIYSPCEGWWMTTGAAMPLSLKAFDEIKDQIGNYKSTDEDPARNAMILRACVSAECSNQVAYVDPPAAASDNLLAAAQKVGRNEPCPCGSGKKYKKCCGG